MSSSVWANASDFLPAQRLGIQQPGIVQGFIWTLSKRQQDHSRLWIVSHHMPAARHRPWPRRQLVPVKPIPRPQVIKRHARVPIPPCTSTVRVSGSHVIAAPWRADGRHDAQWVVSATSTDELAAVPSNCPVSECRPPPSSEIART